jgi:hypothetical protein
MAVHTYPLAQSRYIAPAYTKAICFSETAGIRISPGI